MGEISVIIPTHNRLLKVLRSVVSVLEQDSLSLIKEIMVVVDGKDDNTIEVLSALKLDLVKIIETSGDLGGGAARNIGITASTGKYIAFLDDDDVWMPDKLKYQSEYLADGVFVGSAYSTRNKVSKLSIFDKEYSVVGVVDILLHTHGVSPSTIIVPREALLEVGMFDVKLKANQGRDLFIRLSQRGLTLKKVCRQLVMQDQGEHSRISSSIENRCEAHAILRERYLSGLSGYIRRLDLVKTSFVQVNNKSLMHRIKLSMMLLKSLRLETFSLVLKLLWRNLIR
jgi:glycosyltransferase involved in cell wall biosynthesis